MNDDILTVPEVAELLRIAEKTVYTLAQRGEIPAFKVGGQWRFSRGTIQEWIQRPHPRWAAARHGRDFILGFRRTNVGRRGEGQDADAPVTWSNAGLAVERARTEEGALSLPSRSDTADGLGRDAGPYSTRNSSKGSLVPEAHLIFRALASGKSLDEVRSSCLDGKLLRQAARETRHRIWEALHWRFFAWTPPAWVIADLVAASRADVTSPRFLGLVYLHFARRDRLTFDFVVDKLWPHWKGGARDVRRDDVIDFLAESANGLPVRWRESTRVKLAGNVLSALRDFGLLTGVQRKALQRPVVSPEVVLHLCRLLDADGLRGRALLEARDWRLFLWDIQDTSQALAQLAQRGELRFERSGRTVVLDVPRHPLGEGR